MSSAPDVECVELSALDTLQHGLAGDAQSHRRFEHREVIWRRLFNEARAYVVGHANPPRRTGRQLLTRDEAIIEPAMNRARHDAEDARGLADRDHVAGRRVGGRLEAWNIPIAAQASHLIRGEALTGRR